jgi:serine phosphatase RsbU (regulator of sigma subunit)
VRITPILVGVTRAAIYLWDAENSQFRLSQAYGMPRSLEPRPYAPGEFPLLDAARQEDRLLAYPLEPAQIDEDLVPDTWAGFAPPDPDETEEYLEEEPCLLLAFPLSVKGEALGVLLAEEPNPVNVESLPAGGTNLRLREKRLEIITGISQQAALAIQNDRLQREMVERERLEGEMQLAREIQRTFLPHELPSLPGWELDVRWRTAREVGGDFYDVFELPGGRLGLVISDVADKGMPAALFMTLVRTLVRATVQEVESPSEVLARVNDVLVPDAQQGMYVTLVYAVLEWESGKLTYANAGHNPPILGREKSLETVRLEKGGMALGVLEGSRVAEHEVTLRVGEALIFYTDGITEAFSPDGEMYGEDCLRRTIQEAMADPGGNSNSAQQLSDSIETSVNAFLGGLPLADDLTLMVVRRMGEPPDQEAL